jgi:fatty-acyl-CoA synthase
VHRIDELPKNASGKVLKRELRRQLGGSESAVGRVAG